MLIGGKCFSLLLYYFLTNRVRLLPNTYVKKTSDKKLRTIFCLEIFAQISCQHYQINELLISILSYLYPLTVGYSLARSMIE